MSENTVSRHKSTALDLLQQLRGEQPNDKYRADLTEEFPGRHAPPTPEETVLRDAERHIAEIHFRRKWDIYTEELGKNQLHYEQHRQHVAPEAGRVAVDACQE